VYLGKLIGLTHINERGSRTEELERFGNPDGGHRGSHEATILTQQDRTLPQRH
jgi:hypothetical protein